MRLLIDHHTASSHKIIILIIIIINEMSYFSTSSELPALSANKLVSGRKAVSFRVFNLAPALSLIIASFSELFLVLPRISFGLMPKDFRPRFLFLKRKILIFMLYNITWLSLCTERKSGQ